MSDFEHFTANYPLQKIDKDQTILLQGEVAKDLYVIKSGYVKAYDIDHNGNEQLIWMGSEGSIFPITNIFTFRPLMLFYAATTTCELWRIPMQKARTFLNRDTETFLRLGQQLAERINELIGRLMAVEQSSAKDKIIHTLLWLSAQFPDKPLPMTQQDLANMLGLTRETVSTELKHLRQKGYIDYGVKSITVKTPKLQPLVD